MHLCTSEHSSQKELAVVCCQISAPISSHKKTQEINTFSIARLSEQLQNPFRSWSSVECHHQCTCTIFSHSLGTQFPRFPGLVILTIIVLQLKRGRNLIFKKLDQKCNSLNSVLFWAFQEFFNFYLKRAQIALPFFRKFYKVQKSKKIK